jgi:Protein of unknown function (DUF2530)
VSQSRQGGTGARRPAPPPKEADDRQVTVVITVGWAIALAVMLVLAVRHTLPTDARWWVWTCAFGLAMGLFGLWYVPFLKRHRARLAARRAQLSGVCGPEVSESAVSEAAAGPDSEYVSRESGSNTVSSTETPGRSTKS